jgi:glycosyltransferase involved in cell wall biosynthesis
VFTRELAAAWQARGYPVAVVAPHAFGRAALPEGAPIIESASHHTVLGKWYWAHWWRRLVRWEETLARWCAPRFERIMGRPPVPWEAAFATNVWNAFGTARAALALRPRLVFGLEATGFGLATAFCRGVPRVLMPWGGDIFVAAETTPVQYALIRYALRQADLVLPTAIVAARHVHRRFGVAPYRIRLAPWGIDLELFRPVAPARRAEIRAGLSIKPARQVFLNVRRLHPHWGAWTVLAAFMELARRRPDAHFVLLGGGGTEDYTAEAQTRIAAAGLSDRFTLLCGEATLPRCAELMAAADVFTSMQGRGDMRSWSILQAAAAGGAPVLLQTPEYLEMAKLGFAAEFVAADDAGQLAAALARVADDPARRRALAEQNARYLHRHEDGRRQMDRLIEWSLAAGDKFRRARRLPPPASVSRAA